MSLRSLTVRGTENGLLSELEVVGAKGTGTKSSLVSIVGTLIWCSVWFYRCGCGIEAWLGPRGPPGMSFHKAEFLCSCNNLNSLGVFLFLEPKRM